MDMEKRTMILPGKSGVSVEGLLTGTELAAPGSLAVRQMEQDHQRRVCYTDLDRNGHMNNTRYMDWVMDLLPSAFHGDRPIREFLPLVAVENRILWACGVGMGNDARIQSDTLRTVRLKIYSITDEKAEVLS